MNMLANNCAARVQGRR